MVKLNKVQKNKLDSFKTTSAKIRYLDSKGFNKSEIKSELKIIYQWVFNVLNQNVKNYKENIK